MAQPTVCYWEAMKVARKYALDKREGRWFMEVRGTKLYIRLGTNTRFTCIGEAPIDMAT